MTTIQDRALRGSPDLADHLPMLRTMLEEQRSFRIDQLALLRRTRTRPMSEADLEVEASLIIGANAALADVRDALTRMEAGRYGRCVHCDADLPVERLEILPQAGLCMPCQRVQDVLR
jgi:DnaK suppressor protein